MALLLPKSAFIHIPRTGGSSVRIALRQAGFSVKRKDETGLESTTWNQRTHAKLTDVLEQCPDRFLFAFVREPVAWYRSYWATRTLTKQQWTLPQYPEEREAWGDGRLFPQWVESICELCPGFLCRIYEEYTGFKRRPLESDAILQRTGQRVWVGRTERLQDDLNFALALPGEDVGHVPVGVENQSESVPDVPGELAELIRLSEKGWNHAD